MRVLADHVKNGAYLSVEEFNRHEPSISLDNFTPESVELVKSSANEIKSEAVSELHYHDKAGQVILLPTKKIWGVAIDGDLYIRHLTSEKMGTAYCFYKLMYLGSLSKYFVIKFRPGGFDAQTHAHTPPSSVLREFTVDLKSGKIFTEFSPGKIKQIIKSDVSFAKEKITKDNLDEYIVAYNGKNQHPNIATVKEVTEEQ